MEEEKTKSMEDQATPTSNNDWFLSKWALPVLLAVTMGGAILIAVLIVSSGNDAGSARTPTYFTIPVALLWVKFFQARKKSRENGID